MSTPNGPLSFARRRHARKSETARAAVARRAGAGLLGSGSAQFFVLSAFLAAAFAMGGSARGDIQSLMILRPLAALTLGFGLTSLEWGHIRSCRCLFGLAASCVLLAIVQLIPLPGTVSYALPGHGLIADIDRASGNFGVARPISLAPSQTWNALWSMMPPLAVLVLGAQMSGAEHRKLLTLVLGIGLLSACLGFAQTVSDAQGPLYFYDDMGRGLPVGLLANRNCQAVFLAALLPALGVWARLHEAGPDPRGGRGVSVYMIGASVLGLCLVPLILLTGSRMGAAVGLLAFLAAPLAVRRAKRGGGPPAAGGRAARLVRLLPLAGLAGGAGLVALANAGGRALSLDRLFAQSPGDGLRIQILPTVKALIGQHWPLGTGLGTFKPVYRVFEPDSVLAPSIMNHAHNDWLEVPMTAGVGGALILLAASIAWSWRLVSTLRSRPGAGTQYLTRLGVLIVLLFAVASVSDYHLRTPSIACLLALAAIWAATDTQNERRAQKDAAASQ